MDHNLPTIDEIAGDPAILKGMPLDMLDAIASTADELAKRGGVVKKAVQAVIEERFNEPISAAYVGAGKDTGTVHIEAGQGYEIEANRAKKVEWDQAKLAEVGDRIAEAGDDPHEYIERVLTVPERKYTAWPEHIRSQFEPARTLKPAATTIKLVRKEAA